MSDTARLIRAVQTGRRKLGLDDETYWSMLEAIAGKRSAKELTAGQLGMVLERMRRGGFEERRPCPQLKLIRHLWLSMYDDGVVRKKDNAAIDAYIKRITGKRPFECGVNDFSRVIETLKKWIDRLEDTEAAQRMRKEFVTMQPQCPTIQ